MLLEVEEVRWRFGLYNNVWRSTTVGAGLGITKHRNNIDLGAYLRDNRERDNTYPKLSEEAGQPKKAAPPGLRSSHITPGDENQVEQTYCLP